MNPHQLIQRYLTGEATDAEIAELDRLLAGDPALRKKLIFEAGTDAGLREIALERAAQGTPAETKTISPLFRPAAWLAAAAAVVLLGALGWTQLSRPRVIATLVSGENAAWESSLPTAPGSALTAGYLKLTSGIATIRFRSGAQMILEAPSHVVLKTAMRGQLLAGSAVFDVPPSAHGFVMEAPGGYAVDHGTQFAVRVDGAENTSRFEVLKGEISVHQPTTGQSVRLNGRQGAAITGEVLSTFDGANQEPPVAESPAYLRVGTNGRATYVIHNDRRGKWINPEMLLAKRGINSNWDMRTLLEFDVSKVDLAAVKSVRLRLNQVPSGMGLAARLPLINSFGIYGANPAAQKPWSDEPLWADASGRDAGILLGTFDIPRSQQTGTVGIETAALLALLRAAPAGIVRLTLVRETAFIEGEGQGLVHAFASDQHPEAAGPVLEFTMQTGRP
jgi:ferric-dicitrate binding protein FerR (iron transport regulator)